MYVTALCEPLYSRLGESARTRRRRLRSPDRNVPLLVILLLGVEVDSSSSSKLHWALERSGVGLEMGEGKKFF